MKARFRKAQDWLNRNFKLHCKYEAELRALRKLENQLGAGVAKYESDGTENHDADMARHRHEDALLSFSEQRARVEALERILTAGMNATRTEIEKLEDLELQAVAIDRFINCMKWEEIARAKHVSKAQVYRLNEKMLEQMADILNI